MSSNRGGGDISSAEAAARSQQRSTGGVSMLPREPSTMVSGQDPSWEGFSGVVRLAGSAE